MLKIDKDFLKAVFIKRPPESKKYDFGLLVVIGGSQFYTGSPAFAGMAAFRTGCDMVYVLAPKRAADIIAGFSPNLAAYPLTGDWLDKDDLATLFSITESAKMVSGGRTAVVIGGGLGRSEQTQETILEYLNQVSVSCVIDADAIHAFAKKPEVAEGKDFLITPHRYEFFVLTGKKLAGLNDEQRAKLVGDEAKRLGLTILLKGNKDIIASQAQEIAYNETGSPFMTVGGTGDTLAGVAGALIARGVPSFKAGCAAAYINGMAGQRAGQKLGESMLATDLIEEIPFVLPRKF